MTITAYDPTFDPDKKMPAAVKALLVDFLAALEQRDAEMPRHPVSRRGGRPASTAAA